MKKSRLSPMDVEERIKLMQVAKGELPPTVWIRKARYANLITGEWEEGEILLYGKRIAYVGKKEPKLSDDTEIIDGRDFFLVPGYIEPHAHPFQLYTPLTLADFALEHGTSILVGDNMVFFHLYSPEEVIARMEELADHPVKLLWWVRLSPQSGERAMYARYSSSTIRLLAEHPLVYQGGEVTDLLQILQGDEGTLKKLQILTDLGKRIEGHAPGASLETLTLFSLAGITSDHEAISGEEVLRRLRLGFYVPLRHSSIRRDLPELLRGLRDLRYGWERLMFTTDGSTPPFLREGLTDALLRIAIEEGIDPLSAYRIASMNPAVYYRIDGEVGMIAPGRLADLNFLADPSSPTPVQVMIEGRIVKPLGHPEGKGEASAKVEEAEPIAVNSGKGKTYVQVEAKEGAPAFPPATISSEMLRIPWEEGVCFPVLHFMSDVITVLREMPLPVRDGSIDLGEGELHYAVLIDREGLWMTKGVVSGFAKAPFTLASTYTASQDVILIGSDPERMAEAYDRVLKEPGIHLYARGAWKRLPLPIEGFLSDLPMTELIEVSDALQNEMKELGFPHFDFYYALLFITSTHLPKVRLTEQGLLSIKDHKVLLPSTPISGKC